MQSTVKIQRHKRQWIKSETISLLIFQRLHLRTPVKRSRCMFTGFVAQVEQQMRLTDETDRKEQRNVGWSRIYMFLMLLQLLFFAMKRVNRALMDSVSINRSICFFFTSCSLPKNWPLFLFKQPVTRHLCVFNQLDEMSYCLSSCSYLKCYITFWEWGTNMPLHICLHTLKNKGASLCHKEPLTYEKPFTKGSLWWITF